MTKQIIVKGIKYEVVNDNGIMNMLWSWGNNILKNGETFGTEVALTLYLQFGEASGQLVCLTPEARPWNN